MRATRSYRGQHLMQGLVHRGSLFHVERVHGAHQNFERIARKCFVTLVGQSQTGASPVRFGSLSDQVPTCLKLELAAEASVDSASPLSPWRSLWPANTPHITRHQNEKSSQWVAALDLPGP